MNTIEKLRENKRQLDDLLNAIDDVFDELCREVNLTLCYHNHYYEPTFSIYTTGQSVEGITMKYENITFFVRDDLVSEGRCELVEELIKRLKNDQN